jgi:hypothetical protein
MEPCRRTARKVSAEPRPRDIALICRRKSDGSTLTDIARHEGISPGTLSEWIEADPERSARARAARILAARVWDDKAASVIEEAGNVFELAKAKELAHHCRWRASKIAPRDYGERTVLAGDAQAPLALAAISVRPEEYRKRLAVAS